MPGCAVEDCTNSSVKGFKMVRFPRDVQRQTQWIANVNRANWVPTVNSTLCEVHFARDMWEKQRVDGKRKLKLNAIPTIFGDQVVIKTLTTDITTNLTDEQAHESVCRVISEAPQLELDSECSIDKIGNMYPRVEEEVSDESCSDGTISEDDKKPMSKNSKASSREGAERYNKLEKLWLKSEKLRKQMKKKLQAAKKKIKCLESELRRNEQSNAIRKIFSDDQMKLLTNDHKKLSHWCNASLVKAYQLKFACGTSGYQELLRQKFPLPSLRTLSRKFGTPLRSTCSEEQNTDI